MRFALHHYISVICVMKRTNNSVVRPKIVRFPSAPSLDATISYNNAIRNKYLSIAVMCVDATRMILHYILYWVRGVISTCRGINVSNHCIKLVYLHHSSNIILKMEEKILFPHPHIRTHQRDAYFVYSHLKYRNIQRGMLWRIQYIDTHEYHVSAIYLYDITTRYTVKWLPPGCPWPVYPRVRGWQNPPLWTVFWAQLKKRQRVGRVVRRLAGL